MIIMENTNTNNQTPTNKPMAPDSHLTWAIISTLLCCWPFGIPAIVNAAFSCELYFKSMLENPRGHKLKELFEQLDRETKLQLRNEFNANFTKHPVYNFDIFLNDISNAFVEWRYVFEEPHTEGFYGCYINEFLMFFNCFLPIVKRIAHECHTAR